MSQIFLCRQSNDLNFRSQVYKNLSKWVLWVAESKDDVYTISFKNVIAADSYAQTPEEDSERVLLLYRDEEEDVQTVEVGLFKHEDALKFINWLESSIKNNVK